jgi:hypothetical protein
MVDLQKRVQTERVFGFFYDYPFYTRYFFWLSIENIDAYWKQKTRKPCLVAGFLERIRRS